MGLGCVDVSKCYQSQQTASGWQGGDPATQNRKNFMHASILLMNIFSENNA